MHPKAFSLNIFRLIFCLICLEVSGQNATHSPYSLIGLGDLNTQVYSSQNSLGRISRSMREKGNISFFNPASYSALKFTTLLGGAQIDLGEIKTKTHTGEFSNATFRNFGLAFPLGKKDNAGFAFGLQPLSDIGFGNRFKSDTGSFPYEQSQSAKGGLSDIFAGVGVKIGKHVSVGANAVYTFGQNKETKTRFYQGNPNIYNFSEEKFSYYKGFGFNAGVQFFGQVKLLAKDKNDEKNKKKIVLDQVLGLTFSNKSPLKTANERFVYSYNSQFVKLDSVLYSKGTDASTKMPLSWGIGYSIGNPYAVRNSWLLGFEYAYTNWSALEQDGINQGLKNRTWFGIGAYWVPKSEFPKGTNYLEKIKYSAGYRIENTPIVYQNKQVKETGIGFGLGLPIIKTIQLATGKTTIISRINLTGEYIIRGDLSAGQIQERYVRIGFGFTLNDLWFIRRKYE